jgi:hypothetical protein
MVKLILFKRLLQKLIVIYGWKKNQINSYDKIQTIRKNIEIQLIEPHLIADYKKLWGQLGAKPSVLFLQCLTALSGVKSAKFVPENIHYSKIEPVLNNKLFSVTYNDKNFFERYLPDHKHLFPVAILRGINGVFYAKDYMLLDTLKVKQVLNDLPVYSQCILKPAIETGGGANVMLVQKEINGYLLSNKLLSVDEFIDFLIIDYKCSFVFQHKIMPHPWFNAFNATSINTLRLYTYRSVKTENVHPIKGYIRFGKPGIIVDSSSQGGRTCGVNVKNGMINDFALGKYGEYFQSLDVLENNAGIPIPKYQEIIRIAKEIGSMYNYHRLLGFDFTVDADANVRLLEINTLYIGVINQQMNTGPLFGEFTDEVVEYCRSHKKTVAFHFKI